MVDVLDANLQEINTLIQRGGRMLSLVDLIKLNTVPLEVAAYLVDGMRNGASVLVGALPSGVGKTTLMSALLGVIPSSDRIIPVEDGSMVQELTRGTLEQPKTYVIHEISRGPGWGNYLWGRPVIALTQLVDTYTRLAANLHADSIDGVKAAFRRFATEKAINVFNFIVFIQCNYYTRLRAIDEVWEFDTPKKAFNLVYSNAEGFSPDAKNKPTHQKWKNFLSKCLKQDIYTIEKVAYAIREYAKA
jgi:energy-coupling factor transporter ATP-binding protein EcfA2